MFAPSQHRADQPKIGRLYSLVGREIFVAGRRRSSTRGKLLRKNRNSRHRRSAPRSAAATSIRRAPRAPRQGGGRYSRHARGRRAAIRTFPATCRAPDSTRARLRGKPRGRRESATGPAAIGCRVPPRIRLSDVPRSGWPILLLVRSVASGWVPAAFTQRLRCGQAVQFQDR